MSKLTIKQENFCNAYIETGNASEAYRRSFSCSKMKPESVNRKAVELLENGKVTARVKELQDEVKAKSDITKERILSELECILDAKITDYLEFNGREIKFKDFQKLSEKQVKAIESIKETKYGIELKLHGKSWTIPQICQMLGFNAPIKTAQTDTQGNDKPSDRVIVEVVNVNETLKGSEDEVDV